MGLKFRFPGSQHLWVWNGAQESEFLTNASSDLCPVLSLNYTLRNDALVHQSVDSHLDKALDFKASVGRPLGSRSETFCLQQRENGHELKASWLAHERIEKVIKSAQS